MSARLRAALTRATKRATATEAAWDLRYAFDDLLQSGQVVLRGELAYDATVTLLAIAEPRRGPSHAECWGDYLLAFAGELSKRLTAEGRHQELARSLDQSSTTAIQRGGGREATALLEPFLDILSMGAITATGATLAVPPPLCSAFAQRHSSAYHPRNTTEDHRRNPGWCAGLQSTPARLVRLYLSGDGDQYHRGKQG